MIQPAQSKQSRLQLSGIVLPGGLVWIKPLVVQDQHDNDPLTEKHCTRQLPCNITGIRCHNTGLFYSSRLKNLCPE